ncbi:MAG: hypothetical protein ABSG22_10560 [Sedimentisphaerales bacterium]|jgi:hypothetical protein
MAVISVVLDWHGYSCEQDLATMVLTAPLTCQVAFDNTDDPRLRPLLALTAAAPGSVAGDQHQVPPAFSGHPFNPWLWLQKKSVKAVGPFDYEVICIYSNQANRSSDSVPEMLANPCDQPWDIDWGSEEISQRIDMAYDDDGLLLKPLCNVNGEPFDPPLQEPTAFTTLRITRNQPEWDDKLMSQYANTINIDSFWGYKPGDAMCRAPVAVRMRCANLFYFKATYNFIFTLQDHNWNWGWYRRILNEGYGEAIDIDTEGKKVIVRALDDNGDPTPLPVPLRLSGTRIYPPRPGEPFEPAVPLYFWTKRKMAFSGLNLGR